MKAKVMRRAHQLAKGFEGNYSARMSLALRQAWAEARAPKAPRYVTISLHSNKRSKTWVARIVGAHPTYKFSRQFVNPVAYGSTEWELSAGVYEVCEAGNRYFIQVANGDERRIDVATVSAEVAKMAADAAVA